MTELTFSLGQTVATPGALFALDNAGVSPRSLLARHLAGNCDEMSIEDQVANVEARLTGARIFSRYTLPTGVRVWVITEAKGEGGNRESTCILLPSEY